MEYTNPPLNTSTLLANLQNEGLTIVDERKAFTFLENVSYFRFAAYLRPLKASDKHAYKERTFMETVGRHSDIISTAQLNKPDKPISWF